MKIIITENQFKKTLIPLFEQINTADGRRHSKKKIYAYEFYDENQNPVSVYVGLTCNMTRRTKEHETGVCSWGEKETTVYKFIKNNPNFSYNVVMLEPEYLIPEVAKEKEKQWEEKYRNDGWDTLNIAPTGSLGTGLIYTDDVLKKVAKKYKGSKEWHDKQNWAWRRARARDKELKDEGSPGFWEDITSHFDVIKKQYTDDELRKIAKKYENQRDWRNEDQSSLKVARRRDKKNPGFWKDITSHFKMIKKQYTDDELRKIAKQYEKITHWKGKRGYKASKDRDKKNPGFWKDITSHMIPKKPYYSDDDFRKIANEYETRTQWRDSHRNSYKRAHDRDKELRDEGFPNFFNDITSHMKE